MKSGEMFDRLANSLDENNSYQVNSAGQKMIEQYHSIIGGIEKSLVPTLNGITTDPIGMAKEAAVQIVSSINSSQKGNANFDIMSRLDTMTNGGKTPIDGASFAFNEDDKILQYLEKIQ